MNEIRNLGYFLNSIKTTLPFEDTEDFKKKIDESKEFRIKVQKLVYLSKFFRWDNSYHFNFHENVPYSCQLSEITAALIHLMTKNMITTLIMTNLMNLP